MYRHLEVSEDLAVSVWRYDCVTS